VGKLVGHQRARCHSVARQRLMRWAARFGLKRVVCVSEAVRNACVEAGYCSRKLSVVHNGLPFSSPLGEQTRAKERPFRLGYLGVFSERKGLRDFFLLLDGLAQRHSESWEGLLAGGPQDSEGEQLVQKIQHEFGQRKWWPRVRWCGWAERPGEFLRSIDL